MTTWKRTAILVVYGFLVTMISLWGLEQSNTPATIVVIVVSSFLTIMLVYGVEIDKVDFEIGEFFSGSVTFSPTESDKQYDPQEYDDRDK